MKKLFLIILFVPGILFSQIEEEGLLPPGEEDLEEEIIQNQIYHIVDTMPEFPGGEMEMVNFIKRNFVVPDSLDPTQGETIYVKFVVTDSGALEQIHIEKGVNPLLKKEAIRVIASMPKWSAGIFGTKPVHTWYVVPITIRFH